MKGYISAGVLKQIILKNEIDINNKYNNILNLEDHEILEINLNNNIIKVAHQTIFEKRGAC